MRKGSKKNRIYLAWVVPLLSFAAIACFAAVALLCRNLQSQNEFERWRGESEMPFAQLSCYIPIHETVSVEDVYTFRKAAQEQLSSAALEISAGEVLFSDAWSTTGKVQVSSALGSGEAALYAVGGDFFAFHPIRLISGSYITEDDLMKDRVLLDEDTAWMLFGGTELEGMSLKINGIPFYVAGVVERSEDRESSIAYEDGPGIFMSYEAYTALDERAGIACYEFVMAEPVEGFSLNFAKEKFPLKSAVIEENSGRFSFAGLLKVIKSFGRRSMQTKGLIYPYWENAARYIEDWCALLLLLGLMAAAAPVLTAIYYIIRLLCAGKNKVNNELIPRVRESAGEAIRVRQRRRWERKRGLHEKRK